MITIKADVNGVPVCKVVAVNKTKKDDSGNYLYHIRGWGTNYKKMTTQSFELERYLPQCGPSAEFIANLMAEVSAHFNTIDTC